MPNPKPRDKDKQPVPKLWPKDNPKPDSSKPIKRP